MSDYWRVAEYGRVRLQGYWEDTGAPHRLEVMRALRALPLPVWSVLEVGCFVGTNLRLAGEVWPGASLYGCDINREATVFGQEQLGPRAKLTHMDLLAYLDCLPGTPVVDVVFSCFVLAYVEPTLISRVLVAMRAAARRAVVIAEPMMAFEHDPPWVRLNPLPEYRHNYLRLLTDADADVQASMQHLMTPSTRINAILTVKGQT